MDIVRWVWPRAQSEFFFEMLPVYIMDSNFGLLAFSWLLPGIIDIDRLEQALSRSLSYYPHFAGRLIGSDDWRSQLAAGNLISTHIRVGKFPIPISVADSRFIPDDDLMQQFHPEIVDPVECAIHMPPSPDEPLTRVKVTRFTKTHETAVTMAFCHVLGDGLTFFRFVHMVSQFYCGLDVVHPLPTYDIYTRAPPSLDPITEESARRHVPHLLRHYPQHVFTAMCEDSFKQTSPVNIRFSVQELYHLQAEAFRSAAGRVSRGDALAAYVIAILNRVRRPLIEQIVNLINFRGVAAAGGDYVLPEPSSAGSALFYSYSDIIPVQESEDIASIARRVGETVEQVKDPEFVRRVVGVTSTLMRDIFGADRQAWWGAGEQSVVLSNCYGLNFQSAHFGYPGRVRWFVNGSMERYIRILVSNPIRLPDGSWRKSEGSANVLFRIEHELREPFLRSVEEDRRTWAAAARQVSLPEVSRL